MLTLFARVALVVAVLAAASAAWGQKLRVGLSDAYAPLSSMDAAGEAEGYLVEVVRALCREMGREPELALGDWAELERMLRAGEIDLLMGLYHSEEREQVYAFGPEVFRNSVYFYAKRGPLALDSLMEAFGRRVGVSGPDSEITRRARAEYPKIEWEVYANLDEMVGAVLDDDSLVGFVEEEALFLGLRRDVGRMGAFYQAEYPLMERGLRPVALRENRVLMESVSRAIARIDPSWLERMREVWVGDKGREPYGQPLALSEAERDFLARHPIIRYAGDSAWPPIAFRRGEGELQGIQADFLAELERIIGIRFVYPYFEDWPAVQGAIGEDRADFSSADMSAENVTTSYLKLPLALVVNRSEASGSRLKDFEGRVVSAESGNAFVERFRQRHPEIEFRLVDTEQEGLDLLLRREVDGHVGNIAVCVHLVQARYASALVVADTLDEAHELTFRVRPDAEWAPFLSILNKAINRITPERRQELFRRWIDVELLQRENPLAGLWKPVAALAALVFVVLLWRLTTQRLRRALASTEERLLLAQRIRAGGFFEWYPREERVAYSPEFFRVLGYDEDELKQSFKTFFRLVHPEDLKRVLARQRRYTREGREYEHIFRMQRRDGSWAWAWARGVPSHLYPDGSVRRYVGLLADITAMRQKLDTLQQRDAQSRRASRAKSEFLANMSHEIRTPMNAILGFSRLLTRESTLSSQQSEYVHLINRSGEMLLCLLDDILDMAKIEAGRVQMDWADWNVARVFGDLSRIFAGRCEENGLSFESVIDPDLPELQQIDGTKLRQVLSNLLSNAAKFTSAGGIALRARRELRAGGAPWMVIEVEDTGCGIGAADLQGLFAPFAQGEAGRSTKGGTGLGLAISQEFCRLLGGDLSVRSELGTGSVFTVSIPVRLAKSERAVNDGEGVEIAVDPAAAQRTRVLVVDDNRFSLQYMDRFLAAQGFWLKLAEDGEEAVAMWKLYEPHILLLDLRMPKKDGYAVIEEIRRATYLPQPRILVLTASAFSDQRQRVIDLGADGFLGKPFRESELLLTICRMLDLPFDLVEAGGGSAQSGTNQASARTLRSIEMPDDMRRQLVEACRGGYVKRIDELIALLEDDQPEACRQLRTLAMNFDYDRILAILSASPQTLIGKGIP